MGSFDWCITSCYFILTTLATLGYGDYFPKNNDERVLGIVIMLIGVAFFSYIIGTFIGIVQKI